jgi:hypothetical protein
MRPREMPRRVARGTRAECETSAHGVDDVRAAQCSSVERAGEEPAPGAMGGEPCNSKTTRPQSCER